MVHVFARRPARVAASALTIALALPAVSVAAAHHPVAHKKAAPHWLVWNAKTHTATLTIIAGYNNAQSGFNFDGYGNGKMVISVPAGSHVKVIFQNKAPLPHSAVFTAYSNAKSGSGNYPPAFPGASTPDPVGGTTAGTTQKLSFTANKVGKYALVCAVPGHAQSGMWDVFTVTKGGKASVKF